MRYIVEITETLQKRVIINANNKEDAIEIAQELYFNGDEVLTADNHTGTDFDIIEEK